MKLIDRLIGALALALSLAVPALAMAASIPMYQSGTALRHHLPKFSGNGLMYDTGGLLGDANGIGVSPFAVTDPGLGLAFRTAASGLAHNAFQVGFDGTGNVLMQVSAEGGALAKSVFLNKNG